MQSTAKTPSEYIESLPEDRREAISILVKTIRKNIPKGFAEGMGYGMLGYSVPHTLYPAGYHCDPKQPLPFAGLASQKNYMSLHLVCLYVNQDLNDWFTEEWKQTGKKLDMGKGCVRFKTVEALPLELIAKLIAQVTVDEFIAAIELAQKLNKR